jgi:hypothetical protein
MNRPMRRESLVVSFAGLQALAVCLLLSVQVHAQVAGATLAGTVTDSSGLVVPVARVSIRNTATGLTRDVTTNPAGFYTAPNLLPGTYDVGWELGGIYKASDGVPFTATFGTNGDPRGLNSSDPWAFPNRLTGPGCGTLVNPGNPNSYIKTQCFAVPTAPTAAFYAANCDSSIGTFPQCFNLRGNAGRNILIGPGTSNLDFSVFKNNYIRRVSENFNVQFRAEFFNILNHANIAVPVTPDATDIFDSTGAPTGVAGLLTSTTTTAREIQFAVKVTW